MHKRMQNCIKGNIICACVRTLMKEREQKTFKRYFANKVATPQFRENNFTTHLMDKKSAKEQLFPGDNSKICSYFTIYSIVYELALPYIQ